MHDAQAASSRDVFHRTYFWHFDGESYVLEYDFPWETYHFYQEKQRVFHNYAVYSYENPHYSLLPDFVRKLQCLADESLMDRETTLRFVIAFVQQLQYQPERGEYLNSRTTAGYKAASACFQPRDRRCSATHFPRF